MNAVARGKIEDVLLNRQRIEKKDFFGLNPYASYTGGDYGIACIENEYAPNKIKVLLIGDSYFNPIETFLPMWFSDIYSLDLRHYQGGSFAEMIEMIHPDLVISLNCISTGEEEMYSFGLAEYEESLNTECQEIFNYEQVEISAKENDYNYVKLYEFLQPGETYTLTIDSTESTGKESPFFTVSLYNFETKSVNRVFELEMDCKEQQKWIFTVPEGKNTLLIYAGVHGQTKQVGLKTQGVKLYTGIA